MKRPQAFSRIDAATSNEPLAARRAHIERLLSLSNHLAASDAALLHAVYGKGMSATDIARAASGSPKNLQRQLHRILQRLNSDAGRMIVRHAAHWPASRLAVAERFFLQSRTQRSIAEELDLTVHQVRQEIAYVRAICRDEREQAELERTYLTASRTARFASSHSAAQLRTQS